MNKGKKKQIQGINGLQRFHWLNAELTEFLSSDIRSDILYFISKKRVFDGAHH